MKLFGTDGVRGEAGSYLSAEVSMRVAMAAGIYFKKHSITNKILIGKDTRISGYMIENAIVAGLTAIGYDVIQIGPMPTPAIAFITENMRCDAGIMISASHNSYEDNGVKFFDAKGNKLSKEAEKEIEDICQNQELIKLSQSVGKKIGKAKRIDDVIGRYIVQLKNSFPRNISLKGKKIVLDTANGAGYKVGPTVLEELGADISVLHSEPNGFNINENCGALDVRELCDSVIKLKADLGIALDGDADRLVIVDEQGKIVNGDHLLGALGVFMHSQDKLRGGGIVSTVMSNQGLDDYLVSKNLKLWRSDVGDKNVLETMRKKKINFGGEQSGHIIISDFAKTGDGLVSALNVLYFMIDSGKKASEILRPFSLYPQELVNIKVDNKKPLEKITGLKERLEELDILNIRHLIRYSGTENKLRILLECKDENIIKIEMKKIVDFFKKTLNG